MANGRGARGCRRCLVAACDERGGSSQRPRPQRRLAPDVVGPSLPRPYHFPARNQSFQHFAAPFPGDHASLSGTHARQSRRPQRGGPKDRRRPDFPARPSPWPPRTALRLPGCAGRCRARPRRNRTLGALLQTHEDRDSTCNSLLSINYSEVGRRDAGFPCNSRGKGRSAAGADGGAIQSDAIMLRIFVIGRGGFDLRASCFGRACSNRRPSRR